ncbi:replication protein A subunit RPA3-like protein [Encephalitozoon cuniculi EcunIII-L]|nr:replication protein A subunit RPA3-like protein [Encephalitozoon cuniculi EcunIII-L]UYI27254.1 putative Ten1 [Encephalitozoon cuniculi]
MYSVDVENCEGQDVVVIGRLERVEDGVVVLKCMGREVQVRHQGVELYRPGLVRVCGTVENGVLVESSVRPVGGEFDMEVYGRFVAIAAKYPDLF